MEAAATVYRPTVMSSSIPTKPGSLQRRWLVQKPKRPTVAATRTSGPSGGKVSASKPSPITAGENFEELKKIRLALAAFAPLLAALPASAGDSANLAQVAAPWLAITIGAFAFSAATTARPSIFAKSTRRPSTQTPALPSEPAVESPGRSSFAVLSFASEADDQELPPPLQTQSFSDDDEEVSSEEQVKQPLGLSYDDDEEETQNDAAPVADLPAADLEEEFEDALSETSDQEGPVPAAAAAFKPATPPEKKDGSVLEWRGLDAGGSLPHQLVPLNGSAVHLPAIENVPEGEDERQAEVFAASKEGPVPEVKKQADVYAASAEEPEEAKVAADADFAASSNAEELRQEYDAKLAALKSAQPDQPANLRSSDAPAEPKANQLKSAYEAKVAALKQTAADKEAVQARERQARVHVVDRIRASAQAIREQRQSDQPNLALVKIAAPALGIVRKTPGVLFASFLETVFAIWNWLKRSTEKLVGQKPQEGQLQN